MPQAIKKASLHSLLLVNNVLQTTLDLLRLERGESELGTPRLQGRDDLVHVVTYHAEASVFGVLLDHLERTRQAGARSGRQRRSAHVVTEAEGDP